LICPSPTEPLQNLVNCHWNSEKVFRKKITGTTADRPRLRELMKKLAPGDVVIAPAVDRLSRDTTDLLVIARDMQRAGAGIRSLAEPFLDTTSDFAEIIFAILGVAAKLERRQFYSSATTTLPPPIPPWALKHSIEFVQFSVKRCGSFP
jgi:DNA invertase Pin-like site-specific DNA recombinase